MKFIASKIHWIGILLLVGFGAAAAGLYFDAPAPIKKKVSPEVATPDHGCSMHAGADGSGCGMTAAGETPSQDESTSAAVKEDGCCGGKNAAAQITLPPGHPPVEGYTVAEDPHANCSHGAEAHAHSNTAE